jgi:hypothetical protein
MVVSLPTSLSVATVEFFVNDSKRMRIERPFLLLLIMLTTARSFAGTTLDFWHSYTHAKTGDQHYAFTLASCKRGLFFGSCGISTRSQSWAFSFDLIGDGPVYTGDQLIVSDDGLKPVKIMSGGITMDAKHEYATINLQIDQGGAKREFVGNGRYHVHAVK